MIATVPSDTALWTAALTRVRRELAELPAVERGWLAAQVASIETLQVELDRLFRNLDGAATCADCLGDCCSLGRHHVTLTNLLGYLLDGETPPAPDFMQTCPMLGSQGCRLPVGRRPFNCIIFLCEPLDAALGNEQRERFAALESELRAAYEAIAARCSGASLRGLLLAAKRVGEQPLLTNSRRR
jgi:hypothetical protein